MSQYYLKLRSNPHKLKFASEESKIAYFDMIREALFKLNGMSTNLLKDQPSTITFKYANLYSKNGCVGIIFVGELEGEKVSSEEFENAILKYLLDQIIEQVNFCLAEANIPCINGDSVVMEVINRVPYYQLKKGNKVTIGVLTISKEIDDCGEFYKYD